MNGADLRKARISLGLTQGHLAPLIGLTGARGWSKVSDMERGARLVPWKTAQLMLCYQYIGKAEIARGLADRNDAGEGDP